MEKCLLTSTNHGGISASVGKHDVVCKAVVLGEPTTINNNGKVADDSPINYFLNDGNHWIRAIHQGNGSTLLIAIPGDGGSGD